MKKIFENAVWWSGVIMVGLILGLALQFVRAWTEPTQAPPGGNVAAPINTSATAQTKAGGFTAASLKAEVIEGTTVKGTTQLCIGTDCRDAWPSGGGGGSSCPACSVVFVPGSGCLLVPQGFWAWTGSCNTTDCGGEIQDMTTSTSYRCVWGNWTVI